LENADWVGPLGRLESLAAGLHTLMAPWYGLQPGGASWPGLVCPFRWGFPVQASPSWDIVNAWICRFQAKHLCQGHFIEGEVVWWSSHGNPRTFGIPPQKGSIMHPDPLCIIQNFFGNTKNFLRETAKFCQFPKNFCPNYQENLPELWKILRVTAALAFELKPKINRYRNASYSAICQFLHLHKCALRASHASSGTNENKCRAFHTCTCE